MLTCCGDIRAQALKVAEGEGEVCVGEGDNVDTSRIANCRVQRLLGVEGT